MADAEKVKSILGVPGFEPVEFRKPAEGPNVEDYELGRMAKELNHRKFKNVAKADFGATAVEIENIESDNYGDAWSASFEILVTWRNGIEKNDKRKVRIKTI